jgi:uncharacterized protein (TIGR03067 family)
MHLSKTKNLHRRIDANVSAVSNRESIPHKERRVTMFRFILGFTLMWMPASACVTTDDKPSAPTLDGTWIPTKAEVGGQPLPDDALKGFRLVIKGDKYTVKAGAVTDEGTLKVDAHKTPKTMDIVGTEGPNKGKTYPAIFELKEDALRICYDLDSKQRPDEFKSPKDRKHFLVTYKREKR